VSASILLTTINARYSHSSFGLRYLYANMGELQSQTEIVEWVLKRPVSAMLEDVLARNPTIVGMGVYIWNIDLATRFVLELKRIRPDILVVLGGPEVSFEWQQQPIVEAADYLITGEADLAFAALCRQLLDGKSPEQRVIRPALPACDAIAFPYSAYTSHDVDNRVVYVELSRGCPFRCEFCLSSLPLPVRMFDLDGFLREMDVLYERGLRQFKFVDRTFNLNIKVSRAILDFFYERYVPGLFLHFEMIPDRFPEALRESVRRFPAGVLQFEVGIQTFNEEVSKRISRRQDVGRLVDNLSFLRDETGVHVHADLIVGLPGEDVASFARGFDQLIGLAPQEIQVGVLKRLRGTPIIRHDEEWGMVYSPVAPYEILQNNAIDFLSMQKLKRFAKYWDKYGNSGNFVGTLPLLWKDDSPFEAFFAFSSWLYEQAGSTHSLPLNSLITWLFVYLTTECDARPPLDEEDVALRLLDDLQNGERKQIPRCLKPFVQAHVDKSGELETTRGLGRQGRHLAARR
jgi:radical SAM superfamily enzyme YgiQ (UPF0313 family)